MWEVQRRNRQNPMTPHVSIPLNSFFFFFFLCWNSETTKIIHTQYDRVAVYFIYCTQMFRPVATLWLCFQLCSFPCSPSDVNYPPGAKLHHASHLSSLTEVSKRPYSSAYLFIPSPSISHKFCSPLHATTILI